MFIRALRDSRLSFAHYVLLALLLLLNAKVGNLGAESLPPHTSPPHFHRAANSIILGDGSRSANASTTTLWGSGPGGSYSPSDIQNAYGITSVLSQNSGAGQTIVIIDPYGSPTLASDLTFFDNYFSLPAANLQIVTPFSSNGYLCYNSSQQQDGAFETTLDVQWAHVVAPSAKLIVVQVPDNCYLTNGLLYALYQSTSFALKPTGVTPTPNPIGNVISMSFGASESDTALYLLQFGYTLNQFDTLLRVPGVTLVASSGDSGEGVNWPCVSSQVTCVGGTALTYLPSTGTRSETAWEGGGLGGTGGSGGGISTQVSLPSYQTSPFKPAYNGTMREVPDVAYTAGYPDDAVPNPGVTIVMYDSTTQQEDGYSVGGTSVGAPQWAGIFALINSANGSTSNLGATPNSFLYYLGVSLPQSFYDVTQGCASIDPNPPLGCAMTGYDTVTGFGSPYVSTILASLSSYGTTGGTSTGSTSTTSGISSGSTSSTSGISTGSTSSTSGISSGSTSSTSGISSGSTSSTSGISTGSTSSTSGISSGSTSSTSGISSGSTSSTSGISTGSTSSTSGISSGSTSSTSGISSGSTSSTSGISSGSTSSTSGISTGSTSSTSGISSGSTSSTSGIGSGSISTTSGIGSGSISTTSGISTGSTSSTSGIGSGSISTTSGISSGSTSSTSGIGSGSISTTSGISTGSTSTTSGISTGSTSTTSGIGSGSISTTSGISTISSVSGISTGSAIGGPTPTPTPIPTPPAPLELSLTRAPTSLIATWVSGGGDTIGFDVSIAKGVSAPACTQAVGDVVTSKTFTELAANAEYTVAVCAYNANGTRSAAVVAHGWTLGVAPPAPTKLVVTAKSTSSLVVTWKGGGGNTTGFAINYAAGVVAPACGGKILGAIGSHTVTGLEGGTIYSISVCAYNKNGTYSVAATGTGMTFPDATPVTSLPFTDNFARPNAPYLGGSWLQAAGNFSIANDRAVAKTTGSIAVLDGVSETNMSIQASASAAGTACARLIGRYENVNNYYLASLCRKSNGTGLVNISIVAKGKVSSLVSAAVASSSGALEFVLDSATLTLSINGKVVAHAKNAAVAGPGTAGIQGPVGASFEDFTLNTP